MSSGDFNEISDTIPAGNCNLPAVVLLPKAKDNYPIVVLVHGSGPLDKNETIYSNTPFLDIAEGLARLGIATLRYDKRTYVNRVAVTSMQEETIHDAIEAIKIAKKYSNQVFLLGHSLGAMLAPIIAKQAKGQLRGIIMLAAPARDLSEIVKNQIDYLMPSGASDKFKEAHLNELRLQSPHYFLSYNQTKVAKRLRIPMLFMQGERDYQVTTKEIEMWKTLLKDKHQVYFHTYPLLNHLFMEGRGASSPVEYQQKNNVATYVIDDISYFINTHLNDVK